MKNAPGPHLIISAVAGWIDREKQMVFDHLKKENRVLKEQLGTKKIGLAESQRQRLAAKGR
ncbi:MAG: hypothetical protein V3W41_09065 [Planctomycetota bacterium]